MSLLEMLAASLIIAIVAATALATWALSSRAVANKRVTEMGIYLATREVERLKDMGYMSLNDTPSGSPIISYYDRNGAAAGGAVAMGYKVKAWVEPIVNRDSVTNTEDLRQIRVEVWDANEIRRYEYVRTLITFGGI
jgi:type II secretory pathway pseudopilin PulG